MSDFSWHHGEVNKNSNTKHKNYERSMKRKKETLNIKQYISIIFYAASYER